MSKKIIFTNGLIDLAQPRLGSKIIFRTDDFFASAKRIIDPAAPVFKDGLFDKNGKRHACKEKKAYAKLEKAEAKRNQRRTPHPIGFEYKKERK